MPAWSWALIGAIALIAAVATLILLTRSADRRRRMRTQMLKERFGPEYARAVTATGGQRAAEEALLARARKRERLNIVPLSPEAQEKYACDWRAAQAAFVDDPASAVGKADRLVTEVLRQRGYPTDDFDQAVDDVSVDHPEVAESYRRARRIYLSQQNRKVDTEEQRQALVDYRALFERLLGTDGPQAVGKRNSNSQEARA